MSTPAILTIVVPTGGQAFGGQWGLAETSDLTSLANERHASIVSLPRRGLRLVEGPCSASFWPAVIVFAPQPVPKRRHISDVEKEKAVQ